MKICLTIVAFVFGLTAASKSGQPQVFDVAVIGGGLFGSATAKYVSEDSPNSVLIGLSEAGKVTSNIYGAWFDEGRIAELADSDDVWYSVAKDSINRFREIEQKSGIQFFNEIGFLNIMSASQTEDLEVFGTIANQIVSEGHQCVNVTREYLQEHFPYLSVPTDFISYHQPDYSGVINPRRMVEAQIKIAQNQGCSVIDAHVTDVIRVSDELFEIHASPSDGSREEIVFANKVVVASGVYVNLNPWLHNLLAPEHYGKEPDLTAARETVAFLELSEAEVERLKGMPNIITHYPYGPLDGTYILPPIPYPDGKTYLKLGHLDAFETSIPDENALEEIAQWYQDATGYPEAVQVLSDFIKLSLIPDIQVERVTSATCVIAKTPDMANPYIGYLGDRAILIGGGNGFGANGSDEIGRIGAKLATRNEWTSSMPQEKFSIQWRQNQKRKTKL